MKGLRVVLTVMVSLVLVGLAGAYPPGWKGPKTITKYQNVPVFSGFASIAVSGDTIFMVSAVHTGTPSVWDWWFKRSVNDGLTWGDSLKILANQQPSGTFAQERFSAIVANQWGIHILMAAHGVSGYGIFYTRSTDGGLSFSTPSDMASGTGYTGDVENYSALVTTATGLVAAWQNTTTSPVVKWSIWTRCWQPSGWADQPVEAVWDSYCYPFHPCFVAMPAPAHKVFLIYDFTRDADPFGLFYKVSPDNGSTWPSGTGYLIQHDGHGQYDYNINAAAVYRPVDNKVWVFWAGNHGDNIDPNNPNPQGSYRVRYSGIDESGNVTSFKVLTSLNQAFDQKLPRVSYGPGDSVNVVWEDNRFDQTHYQIYYRCGSYGATGMQWGDDPKRISEDANQPPNMYDDLNPDIAFLSCSGSRVAVWDGYYNPPQDQSRQIWYHKKSMDVTPPGAPGGLQVTPMMGCLYLYWTPLPVGAAGYNVYRAVGVMPPFVFQKLNPQPVTQAFYFDCSANLGYCYTYKVTALDCAENEGSGSNYAHYFGCSVGDAMASVDVGNPTPSSNTVRRSGYYAWGNTPDSTVDYDPDSLIYRFTGLAPDSFYLLGVGYFDGGSSRGRLQSLSIDGVEVHGRSLLPGWPAKMVYLVPRRAYQDGAIDVSFVRDQGLNAVVAQLWLYQAHLPGGGPQSSEVVDLQGAVAKLYPAHPNPTTGAVQFEYVLATAKRVTFAVYDVSGRLVRKLVDFD